MAQLRESGFVVSKYSLRRWAQARSALFALLSHVESRPTVKNSSLNIIRQTVTMHQMSDRWKKRDRSKLARCEICC